MPPTTTRCLVVGVLGTAALAYAALPYGSLVQAVWYLLVAAAALGLAVHGVRANGCRDTRIWALLLGGLACRWVGDALWFWLQRVMHDDPFPSAADVAYLVSYLPMAVALALMVRGRQPGHDRAATLDAAIVAGGAGLLAAVFVIVPTVTDTSQGALSRGVSTSYPLAALLLLAVLARLWTSTGRTVRAYNLLAAGLLFLFAGDIGYDAVFLTTGLLPDGPWLDVSYLLMYACVAATALHPSMRALSEPVDTGDDALPRPRLVAMAVASMLGPGVLLAQGLHDGPVHWHVIGLGSIVISALVLARLGGLLAQVRQQAQKLAGLARTDGLTGLPNRRTWDHQLARATAVPGPLWVAILDLDHFKQFNDTSGHVAGDRLLREAAAAWRDTLPADAFLARYGGEEFTVLMRGEAGQAHAALAALAAVTPAGQTFSAGLAGWDGHEDPAALIARADAALYEAKGGGRGRVCTSHLLGTAAADGGVPGLRGP
jgi:diguanylate cyclase (GGDEF)-like protein